VLYSALGHTPATYQEPQFRQFMRGAIVWGLAEADQVAEIE
jgi:type 1 glutamine amidotransferase